MNRDEAVPAVRRAVRGLLESTPAYTQLDAETRRAIARALVTVGNTATALILDEVQADETIKGETQAEQATAEALAAEVPFGTAVDKVAGTTKSIINAVSFPQFVTELINGVFQALVSSSIQQMHAYVELLDNVAASTAGYDDANGSDDAARAWLANRFQDAYELVPVESDTADSGAVLHRAELQTRDGGKPPTAEALRAALGIDDNQTPPTDPEDLVPYARRQLARQRQQTLATLVMLGMQRIVIDGGHISAAMRVHVDARSALERDQGSQFGLQNEIAAKGSFGYGPWGAEASMKNTITYVTTEQTQTTEAINATADLNSSVEVMFRSDYVPLNRMANADQVNKILANSRNPAAGLPAIATPSTNEAERSKQLASRLNQPPPLPTPPPPPKRGEPGKQTSGQPGTKQQPQSAGPAGKKPPGQPAGNQAAKPSNAGATAESQRAAATRA